MVAQFFKVVLVGSILILQTAAVKVKDVDPMRLALNNMHKPEAVEAAVKRAATDKSWVLTKKDHTAYTAELRVRAHYLKVLVAVDAEAVTITYLDSKNLDYDGESIHTKYATWSKNFLRAIDLALNDVPPPAKPKAAAPKDLFERALALNGLYSSGVVEKALRKAATERNWILHRKSERHFEGETTIRDHFAKVQIDITAERLRITYLDSKNLGYDGKTIHSKYFSWVENLLDSVKEQLEKK